MTQEQQVIDVLRAQGGFATLRRLNEVIDFSTWKTKTPEASVRRIVQNSDAIFEFNRDYGRLRNRERRFLVNSRLRMVALKVLRCLIMLIIKVF